MKRISQTNQGRKIKFTAITKKSFPNQYLTDQLNDTIDDSMSEKVSTKYYEQYELTPLMESIKNNKSF